MAQLSGLSHGNHIRLLSYESHLSAYRSQLIAPSSSLSAKLVALSSSLPAHRSQPSSSLSAHRSQLIALSQARRSQPRSLPDHACEINPPPASWQELAARKRQRDIDEIPLQWKLSPQVIQQAQHRRSIADDFLNDLLDSETRRITNLEVPTLMAMTGNGSLSAVSLVTAFCTRAAFGHQLIGFKQAMARAKELDEHWNTRKRPIGPLHGLPITLKDQYHVKGMDTTMAYVGWIDTFEGDQSSPLKRRAESEIVRELKSLGAIVIAKSTLVQSLQWINKFLGEGAVQALKGSAIGIGSDNGGSVSMPAACNGVYSIKPSAGRLSFQNVPNSAPGQNNISTVPGFLGSSVSSLKYLLKSVISSEPWLHDPEVTPLPWREQQEAGDKANLTFGLLEFDGVVTPHPPIQRGLRMVVEALRVGGHDLVPWNPPSHQEALEIQGELTGASGGYDVFENLALSGEPLVRELREDYPEGKPKPPLNAIEVEKAVTQLRNYRQEYHKRWMATANTTKTGRPVDALILPVLTSAALIPGDPFYTGYITVANVVDHTTMVIPVTHADKLIDKFNKAYSPANELDKKIWQSYDPALYHGAPVGIQIQCGRLEEEKILNIAQVIVDALAKNTN
ncbi:Acetamidase [Neonectria ditissima]|uniref:Acetamidase n=1 Tax=Neonectria ditissima TaxID=78410 RepID=A0A0P7APS5_9HYPO|nr:Acetamidase [Neonectria ditissima]